MQYSWSMVRQLHKMTAATVLDVLARLRGSAGQAGDPVSALTQGRIQSAPTLLKLLESECPDIWIRHPRYTWPVGWQNIEEPVESWDKHCRGHPPAGLYLGWTTRKRAFLPQNGFSETRTWDCLCVASKDCSHPCTLDAIKKWQGRHRNLEPEEPTTFLDHVYVLSDAFNATANHVRKCIKWMHSVTLHRCCIVSVTQH